MLWIKAFHVIFVVTWFAGLFYLPRLYVYHAMSEDRVSLERFKVMEWKLFVIMTIGAAGSLFFGLWLLFGWWWPPTEGWLHAKLGLVALLFVYHGYLWVILKRFREDRPKHSHVFYRWINEIPALFLIAIVILVIVKPF